jgi:acetoacetyl-CoA synthetase
MMDRTTTIEMLSGIWQRLLRRPRIGNDDNFFALGGNPALANDLFEQIAETWGRVLPGVMIYQAPTISSLSDLLVSANEAPRCPPVLLLREGAKAPPIFFAHGMGGDVMQLFNLIQRIPLSHPLYGLQTRGIDGLNPPFDRIEDMAEFHLHAIEKLQPKGPYFLVGYSLGGLVTLEIAQRLLAVGHTVGLLAMLDSYPHRRNLALHQNVRLLARSVRSRLSSFKQRSRTSREVGSSHSSITALKRSLREGEEHAWKRYQPRFYDGKLYFVKAATKSYFPDDPVSIWGHLVRGFEFETVLGDHNAILNSQVESLAAVLSRRLAQALRES